MSNEEAIIVLRDTARNNVNTVHIACMIGIDAIKEKGNDSSRPNSRNNKISIYFSHIFSPFRILNNNSTIF